MGTLIKAVSISSSSEIQSSIAHAISAGKHCLRLGQVNAEEIDIILNVGVYRDSNTVEPAMAALIQKGLGINLDLIKYPGKKPTASFDLMNGACGALNAVQVASAFFSTGSSEYVLIVSSDAHPSLNPLAEDFPYATAGGAMLLEWSDRKDHGFGRVQVRTSNDDFLGLESFTELYRPDSREQVTIRQDPSYKSRLLHFMADSISEYVAEEKLSFDQTLLIISPLTSDFSGELAKRLNIAERSLIQIPDLERDPYSSAMAFGYQQAILSGALRGCSQILFLAASAGLTSACAVYRLPHELT